VLVWGVSFDHFTRKPRLEAIESAMTISDEVREKWSSVPKPWNRENCYVFYLSAPTPPTDREVCEISGRPRRTIEDWKRKDNWRKKRLAADGADIFSAATSRAEAETAKNRLAAKVAAVRAANKGSSKAVDVDVEVEVASGVRGKSDDLDLVRSQPISPEFQFSPEAVTFDRGSEAKALALSAQVRAARIRHLSLSQKMFLTADYFFTFANELIEARKDGRKPDTKILRGLEAFCELAGKGSPLTAATSLAETAIALERKALVMERLDNAGELRQYLLENGFDLVRITESGGLRPLTDSEL
jgi:hypothetical protein